MTRHRLPQSIGVLVVAVSAASSTSAAGHRASDFVRSASPAALHESLVQIGFPEWWPVPQVVGPKTVVGLVSDRAKNPGGVGASYSTDLFEPGAPQEILDRYVAAVPASSLGLGAPRTERLPKNDLAAFSLVTHFPGADGTDVVKVTAAQSLPGDPAGVLVTVDHSPAITPGELFASPADFTWQANVPKVPGGSVLTEASYVLNRFAATRVVETSLRYENVLGAGAFAARLKRKAGWTRGAKFAKVDPNGLDVTVN